MEGYEYCEVYWPGEGALHLTFYCPSESKSLTVDQDTSDGDPHESVRKAVSMLELNGWQLSAAPFTSAGLVFRRRLH